MMENRTVDKMMLKIMDLESPKLPPLIDILHNHNYLGYFPHPTVTNKALELVQTHP